MHSARLTYMSLTDIAQRLVQAQTRNGLLLGDELAAAAAEAANLAARTRARFIAADGTGERIIGAALAPLANERRPAALTRRLDGAVTAPHLRGNCWSSRARGDGGTAEVACACTLGCCRPHRLPEPNSRCRNDHNAHSTLDLRRQEVCGLHGGKYGGSDKHRVDRGHVEPYNRL
jgi:hypothetical protein